MEQKGSKAVHLISRILACFSIERKEIGTREVGQRLGISPGNVHRLLTAMEAVAFLEKTPARRYRLGERLFELGMLYPHHSPLRRIVRPHAEELARHFGANAHLAIPSSLHPHSVSIIDRIQNLQSHLLVPRIALNVPIHCTGVGKAIFAFLDCERREKILRSLLLTRYTEKTIVHRGRLRAELGNIRRNRFAVDLCEEYENVCCVAVPLFRGGRLVGALSLSDSAERIHAKNIPQISRVLKEKAEFISRQL